MSCTICGRSVLPGAKLCVQCRKALKRARQETVSQLEPMPRRTKANSADKGDRFDVRGGLVRGARAWPYRMRIPASLVALGIVVVTTGYFFSHLRGAVADQPEAEGPGSSQKTLTGGAYVPLPVTPLPSREAPPAELTVQAVGPDAVPAPTIAAKPAVPRPAKAARPRDPAVAAEPPTTRFEPPPPPVASAPPQPDMTPKPVVPDRWQLLSEAIARCAGEGFLGGVICEQRARWQYCEGSWGKVAQCPGAMNSDFQR